MLTRMTNAAGALLICDGENEMFNDQVPKPILKTLHARKDPFALEMVSIGGGLRFYVRNRTKPDAELQALFVPVPGRPARDWLRLGQDTGRNVPRPGTEAARSATDVQQS